MGCGSMSRFTFKNTDDIYTESHQLMNLYPKFVADQYVNQFIQQQQIAKFFVKEYIQVDLNGVVISRYNDKLMSNHPADFFPLYSLLCPSQKLLYDQIQNLEYGCVNLRLWKQLTVDQALETIQIYQLSSNISTQFRPQFLFINKLQVHYIQITKSKIEEEFLYFPKIIESSQLQSNYYKLLSCSPLSRANIIIKYVQDSHLQCFKQVCLYQKENPMICVFVKWLNAWTIFLPDLDFLLKTRYQMQPFFCGISCELLDQFGITLPKTVSQLKTFNLASEIVLSYQAQKRMSLMDGRQFMRSIPTVPTYLLAQQNKQQVAQSLQQEQIVTLIINLKQDILQLVKKFVNDLNIIIGGGFVGRARIFKLSNYFALLELSTTLGNDLQFEVYKFDAFFHVIKCSLGHIPELKIDGYSTLPVQSCYQHLKFTDNKYLSKQIANYPQFRKINEMIGYLIDGYNKIENELSDMEINLIQYIIDTEYFELYLTQIIKHGKFLLISQDSEHLVYPLMNTFIEKCDSYFKTLIPSLMNEFTVIDSQSQDLIDIFTRFKAITIASQEKLRDITQAEYLYQRLQNLRLPLQCCYQQHHICTFRTLSSYHFLCSLLCRYLQSNKFTAIVVSTISGKSYVSVMLDNQVYYIDYEYQLFMVPKSLLQLEDMKQIKMDDQNMSQLQRDFNFYNLKNDDNGKPYIVNNCILFVGQRKMFDAICAYISEQLQIQETKRISLEFIVTTPLQLQFVLDNVISIVLSIKKCIISQFQYQQSNYLLNIQLDVQYDLHNGVQIFCNQDGSQRQIIIDTLKTYEEDLIAITFYNSVIVTETFDSTLCFKPIKQDATK